MKKIISLFQRNYDGDNLVRNEVVPGAEWVLAGEGVATRKFDGTCCLVRNGKLYKRRELRGYPSREIDGDGNQVFGYEFPANFELEEIDNATHKAFGWVPVLDSKEDRWHREAFAADACADGTYELCGPKVQGNPECLPSHGLISHEHANVLHDCPRDFDGIKAYLEAGHIEGVVWHHPDGRMVKIKAKDFGIKRTFPT